MQSVLLIVSDEQLSASLVPMLKGELGLEVVAAPVADAAIDSGEAYDIVLVDVAADSIAARVEEAVKLKQSSDAPLLFLTASTDAAILAETQHARPAGYVLKPVVARELRAALELAWFRKNAERETDARERFYKTTLRCIADAIITADDGARVTFMNSIAEQLTGWSEAEAIGRSLNDVFVVETESADKGGDGGGQAPVLRLRARGGDTIIVEHNASPIIEDAGVLYGVVVTFRDITERRRSDQRLALSDRMTSIGTLAAGIAHELNNPLAFVTSNLEFAVSELARLKAELANPGHVIDREVTLADVGDAVDALKEARDGAARAAHIVKDMKVFMRGDGDSNLLVDVNRAVTLAARLTSNEIRNRADLEIVPNPQAPAVLADEGKLVQVLVNVLTNAVQALDEKASHKIKVATVVAGDRVLIQVSDSGRGISADHIGRIFEPFFTTKAVGEGLGLGLSIAHSIITNFGGTISAQSEPGAGTTMTIALPSGEHAAAPKARVAAGTRGRVLVVDDEALIGTAIRRILTKHGIDVVVEDQGRAAFDRLAAGERYDVVLCDLMMPGFSGVDLYEGLDTVAPDMKSRVVFMTGNAFTPKASELFENTRNVRLEKPFVPADLTRAITEVMTRHGAKVEI